LLETVDALIAGWDGNRDELRSEDTALIVGGGGFLYASGAELYWRSQQAGAVAAPFFVRGPAWGSALIAGHLQMRGTVLSLSTGCSSSANALLVATEMLQRGRARRVLVVGAEGLSAVTLSGFASLMLLDPEGCRPFDRHRAGLQIGEGVAALMLEADTGDGPGVTLRGGANLCDTHHLTSASPDGSIMREVMCQAMDRAGVSPADIVAIKAHGTGSIDSDRAEGNALRSVFGDALPPVVGLKRYVGHTLGACGAVETAAWIACLKEKFLPSTAGFDTVDAEINLTPTRTELPASPGPYLLNFFGFGGNYTSLVMGFA
jgi:3-oxoacyl-(acyl-carrier-protein) synthase